MSVTMHQRAPRTPESYFNVPESITLLNIVKSDRIQSAFQSNRKNHSSVWEMVAGILNRYNDKKRSAKQCCNRYENLKKIYTQLKRNPEKHVRRNWPYMYLFREIEEQRGECWGTNAKRSKTETYYQRRRAAMLQMNNNNNNSSKELQQQQHHLTGSTIAAAGTGDGSTITMNCNNNNNSISLIRTRSSFMLPPPSSSDNHNLDQQDDDGEDDDDDEDDVKDDSNFNFDGIAIKKEFPDPDYEEDNDNTFMHNNYNGHPEIYMNGHHDNERNILHPDVIVDTDHVTDSSSISLGTKRKLSTSTDAESTNYELIEYLKKREKRDEEMFKRMEEREERLIRLLERTVVAIERIASQNNT